MECMQTYMGDPEHIATILNSTDQKGGRGGGGESPIN